MKATDILARGRRLAAKPLLIPDAHKLNAAYEAFQQRTPRSAKLNERARTVLPRGSQHTLPPADPYPLFMDRGAGALVTDVDGNEYTDFVMSGGAIILGHNDPTLNRHIVDVIESKTNFHGYFDEIELDAAQQIIDFFPSIERVRFTASGAEAVLAAARIARAFTGNKKIIKFRGGYHGWGDQFMADLEVPGSDRFMASGVPDTFLDETVLVYQNDLDALDAAFRDHAGDGIAAVVCEPYGGESGLVPFVDDFHKPAMEIAHRHGALYIFDEVVTGFRVGKGGAQGQLGIDPDLTTLGKALMNGYPGCGAVCGRAEVMETANTSIPDGRPSAYVAGTTSGNVLSAAAAYHTIRQLADGSRLEEAIAVADYLVAGLNELFVAEGFDFFAYNFGTMVRIELTAPHAVTVTGPETLEEIVTRRGILAKYMLPIFNSGVLSRWGRDFLSCAHNREDCDRAIAAYAKMLDLFA